MTTPTDRIFDVLREALDQAYDLAAGRRTLPGGWMHDDPAVDPLFWRTWISTRGPEAAEGHAAEARSALTLLLVLPDEVSLRDVLGVEELFCPNELVRRAAEHLFRTLFPGESVPAPGTAYDPRLEPYAARGR